MRRFEVASNGDSLGWEECQSLLSGGRIVDLWVGQP